LPEPLSPTRAVAVPAGTATLTPSSATTAPKRWVTLRAARALGIPNSARDKACALHDGARCRVRHRQLAPHYIDDRHECQSQRHEHQLRNQQEAVYSAPGNETADDDEADRSHPAQSDEPT